MRELNVHRRTPLASGWALALTPPGGEPLEWIAADVPGTAASALRAAGCWDFDTRRDFDAEDAWWRLRFDAAPGPARLGFGGIATLAEVWLDGTLILESRNMFRRHEVDVELVGTQHELRIRCRALAPELARKRPRPRWRVPMLADQQLRHVRTTVLGRTPGWSPPCAPVGPWRPVWIERGEPRVQIERLRALVDGSIGRVHFDARIDPALEHPVLVLTRGDARHPMPIARRLDGHAHAVLEVPSPALWWPHTHGDPALYEVAIEARRDREEVRIALGRVGFRSIQLERSNGDFALRINDVPIFCRGACWTPPDVVSLASHADQERASVAGLVAAGMNMLRIAGTMVYASASLLDALDEAGVLLWHDLMFANMDYPEDNHFVAEAVDEVEEVLRELGAHAALAIVCGNSEVEQQAAMSGAPAHLWSPPLFHRVIPPLVAAAGVAYVPSSAHGGDFPHAASAGSSSYYGVGAYRRPLIDARTSELRFASECLAFANLPATRALPGGAAARVTSPWWKMRSPRDAGAGWDFDDVRDHYVREIFGVDPFSLRASDHARYLAYGRATSAEVMARSFAEWRRAGSHTRGALVLFLRDLWPGAGWGLLDAAGAPKSAWYALRRVLAPRAVAILDEGINGLAIHVHNDRAEALRARLVVQLWQGGSIACGSAERLLDVPAHGARVVPASGLFDAFLDLSHVYRFGPPIAEVVHARLEVNDTIISEDFHLPAGAPAREPDVGIVADARALDATRLELELVSARFAHFVSIDCPGWRAADDHFHLAPGARRRIVLDALPERPIGRARGSVTALNSMRTLSFDLP